jgi:hypothetical protein
MLMYARRCVRYTSLVDPHINKLALCLRDDNLVVPP